MDFGSVAVGNKPAGGSATPQAHRKEHGVLGSTPKVTVVERE